MSGNIWNEIANKYERLWVQKYSLAPTRKKIVELIREFKSNDNFKLLDIGCGTGQLIGDLIKIRKNGELFKFLIFFVLKRWGKISL